MDWKEFLKPDFRKILLFLLPMILLTVVYVVSMTINSDEWKIDDTPVNFIIFHFPCFIEKKLFCSGANCCFASIQNQIFSSLISYLPWFLFSWFIVWANDKVELRGYLWRKIQEKETSIKEIKTIENLPIEESEIVKKEQSIREQEEFLKQEKEKIYKTMDELNTKKLLEMGVDITQDKIRCSICKNWEPTNKKNLASMIKQHGIDIIWKYKCKNCKKLKPNK
jgi:hypothetical protein